MRQLTIVELEAGLEHIQKSPKEEGVLALIVRRPGTSEREVLKSATLDSLEGLLGDSWKARGSKSTPDKSANLEMQLTVMNCRVISLLAGNNDRWQLAGDQLFVDLDISLANLPVRSRLGIGSAIIEVTAPPHTGCVKFLSRFGPDALKFVNSPIGRELRLRGLNAKVVQSGIVQTGDVVRKISAS